MLQMQTSFHSCTQQAAGVLPCPGADPLQQHPLLVIRAQSACRAARREAMPPGCVHAALASPFLDTRCCGAAGRPGRAPLRVVRRRIQHGAPLVPGPHELEVGQVVGEPVAQAPAQLGVHGAQAREALAHARGHGARERRHELAHVHLRTVARAAVIRQWLGGAACCPPASAQCSQLRTCRCRPACCQPGPPCNLTSFNLIGHRQHYEQARRLLLTYFFAVQIAKRAHCFSIQPFSKRACQAGMGGQALPPQAEAPAGARARHQRGVCERLERGRGQAQHLRE